MLITYKKLSLKQKRTYYYILCYFPIQFCVSLCIGCTGKRSGISVKGLRKFLSSEELCCLWSKWRPCPYMVKTFKNLLLQNQKTFDLETWHVALGTQALLVYVNDDPGLTLTYFTSRSNWVAFTFEWGKLLQSHLMDENLQQRTTLNATAKATQI